MNRRVLKCMYVIQKNVSRFVVVANVNDSGGIFK